MKGEQPVYTGQSVKRVDALDKVTGRTKYTDDLCDKKAYVARVLHSTIANGKVLSFVGVHVALVVGVTREHHLPALRLAGANLLRHCGNNRHRFLGAEAAVNEIILHVNNH